MLADVFRLLVHLDTLLQPLGIRYVVGGSLASSVHGEVRATNDIDELRLTTFGQTATSTRHDLAECRDA